MSMAHRSNTLRASTLFLVAAALVASGAAARADQIVYFVNGKAITVKKVEKGDRLTILEIEGGGRIGIPTVQIDRIEELAVAAAVPQVAVPAVLPAPQPEPQAANQIPPPPAAASTLPAGPGTGGRVAANSPANGAKPLAFGGDPSEEAAPVRPRPGFQSTPPGNGGSTTAMTPGQQNQRNSNMMTGGPGAFQRGRPGGRNGKNGRLPAAAYLPPKNDPGSAAGAPAGQPGAAQQPPPGTSPVAPPPTAGAPPPPPPPPDPAEADPGSSDGSADDGAAPETGTEEPASGDGDSGQN